MLSPVALCLGLLGCALFLGLAGCAMDSQKGEWVEFWKDVRGDNMKMSSDFPSPK
jgi:hypothetical protein